MPITRDGNGTLVETPILDKDQFDRTGVIHDDSFAICDERDRLKQFRVDVSSLGTRSDVTLKAPSTPNDTHIILTLPNASGTLLTSASFDSFTTIQADSGTYPVATGISTLTLSSPGTT